MHFNNNHIKNFISLFIVSVAFFAFQANSQELTARKHGTIREQVEQSALNKTQQTRVQEILDFAFKFKGVPYRHGASSPRAFDCSGFTSYVFKRFGISLDRRSGAQINDGRRISRSELQPGDLVFFNGRAVNKRIGHVGIVTEVDKNNSGGFKFIHAAVHTGITESHSSESYYSKRYMGACRVVEQ
ncbi:MAG: C40 family peptidase [Muribaculaceae bacterium]|nr:C40 family peptidase [Muribaculaceae bacterium]